jgi:hypothetical protein
MMIKKKENDQGFLKKEKRKNKGRRKRRNEAAKRIRKKGESNKNNIMSKFHVFKNSNH